MTPPPVARTGSGAVAGSWTAGGIAEFLGIPYAAAGRFEPPAGPRPWTGTRPATEPGPAAPQPARAVADFTHGPTPPTSEAECLNLNVWTPALEGARPVLVFVHGGGFAIGHGSASLYRGDSMAAAGEIVVVSLNYRLGSLGWLAHPDLGGANWGLQDQVAALRWVQDNIAQFGGDPARVTLAGQSAGALCAADMLLVPAAQGRFGRVILQSPPFGDVAQPMERSARWAEALCERLGSGGGFGLAALRAALPAEIVAAHEELLGTPAFRGTRGALPTIDPATLPASPLERPGASPEVDVLLTVNADEGSFFFGSPWRPAPPPERIPGVVAHLTGEEPAAVFDRYGEPGPAALRRIATDYMIARPAAAWADAREAAGGRVQRHRVTHPGAGADLGATHTTEVPLVFGTWRDGGPGQRLGGQADPEATARAAASLQRVWIDFVTAC